VKPLYDAECSIVGYKAGTGKYKDMLGSFKCELVDNPSIKFDISGMNDSVRRTYRETHPIGTIVTFTYIGKTERGIPRHPQYLRIRTMESRPKKQSKTKQSKTKHSKTKQSKTKQSKTKRSKTKQSKTKQSKTKTVKSKPRTKTILNKDIIIRELNEMRKKAVADRATFKSVAYSKAIKSIKEHFKDRDIISVHDVTGVPNIGTKIRLKIKEILETGYLEAAERVRHDPKIILINQITDIYGIGPSKAKTLVENRRVTSIDDLRTRQDELLNSKQIIGLRYQDDISRRIPRREIDKHNIFLQKIIRDIDRRATITIVGSYLRNHPDSGDIDILITHPDNDINVYRRFISRLGEVGYITELLAYGDKKFMGLAKLSGHKYHRRIDVLYTPIEEYPFALLYFTGSGRFNTTVRKIATEYGYRLSEHGIRHIDPDTRKPVTPVDMIFRTEHDIFDFLNIAYLPPELREPINIVRE
jgi:DNA polymerase/3'-5' exonuclease PolX